LDLVAAGQRLAACHFDAIDERPVDLALVDEDDFLALPDELRMNA
jgi:hypothetical protein